VEEEKESWIKRGMERENGEGYSDRSS